MIEGAQLQGDGDRGTLIRGQRLERLGQARIVQRAILDRDSRLALVIAEAVQNRLQAIDVLLRAADERKRRDSAGRQERFELRARLERGVEGAVARRCEGDRVGLRVGRVRDGHREHGSHDHHRLAVMPWAAVPHATKLRE